MKENKMDTVKTWAIAGSKEEQNKVSPCDITPLDYGKITKPCEVEKVAIYCRVSTQEQRENQNIQTQVSSGKSYVALHASDGKFIQVIDWYLDDGVSGVLPITERPEGVRLLADAKKGRFNTVLIWKVDRIGRKASVILNAVEILEGFGIRVSSMTEPFDTATPAGRFMLTMLAGFAGYYRDEVVENSIEGTNRRAREGQWLGGIVPYGYKVVGAKKDARLVISEKSLPGVTMSEADVVSLIYKRLVEENKSCFQLADELNALRIPPAYVKDNRAITKMDVEGKRKEHTAGIWRPSRIRNMIVNPVYKGIHVYGKRTKNRTRELIERHVPAIVDEETWQKAQQVLKSKRLFSNRNAKQRYLLKGLVRCGLCGLTYVGCYYRNYSGGNKRYYRCNGKTGYRGPYEGKCPSKAVNADALEEAVWAEIQKILLNPTLATQKLNEIYLNSEKKQAVFDVEISMIEKALGDKQTERERMLDLYRRQTISLSDLEGQLTKISAEESTLRTRLTELHAKSIQQEEMEEKLGRITELLGKLQNTLNNPIPWEVKRKIVELLVWGIKVDTLIENGRKKNEVTITFAFWEDMLAVNRTGRGS